MWPDCFHYGVAAITYHPFETVDLSKYSEGEPKHLWKKLAPAQKASLHRVAYEMRAGDTIYVKEGPNIVGQGKVLGSYRYDRRNRIRTPGGHYWNHQIPVRWRDDFEPIPLLLGAEPLTVLALDEKRIQRIERARGQRKKKARRVEVLEGKRLKAEIAFRQRNRAIIAAKKVLSDGSCEICEISLKAAYGLVDNDCLVAHHLNPIGDRRRATKTKLKDILLVCPNCHAVAHSKEPPLSPARIRRMIRR
jgi:hypothetical protein